MTATHRCPGGCGETVPNAYFACGKHWGMLPARVRSGIYRTKRLSLLDDRRQAAVAAAVAVYGDAAPPEWRGFAPDETAPR